MQAVEQFLLWVVKSSGLEVVFAVYLGYVECVKVRKHYMALAKQVKENTVNDTLIQVVHCSQTMLEGLWYFYCFGNC